MAEQFESKEKKEKMAPEGDIPPAYEASYLNLWTILLAGVGLLVVIGIVLAITALLYSLFGFRGTTPGAPSPPTLEEALIPGPRLQAAPQEDLQQLLSTQQARLESYGWVDEDRGIAHIPIDQAMRIVAEQGFPEAGVVVQPVAPPPDDGPAPELGAQLFSDLGCGSCHQQVDTQVAPTLVGIYGEPRLMESGETVLADEEYLRTSITNPQIHIVAGYAPIMPSYSGRVTEDQLDSLVAYMRSLGDQ
jgi:mono/diheme cytochrome c family protein